MSAADRASPVMGRDGKRNGVDVSRFHILCRELLGERQRERLHKALAAFTRTKSARALCFQLADIIPAQHREDLLLEIRKLVPQGHRRDYDLYNSLVPSGGDLEESNASSPHRVRRKGGQKPVIDEGYRGRTATLATTRSAAAQAKQNQLGEASSGSLTDLLSERRHSESSKGRVREGSQAVLKIRLIAKKGQGLGFNVRGGAEFGLGIYVSRVDEGGVAAKAGLHAGDQIVAVNDSALDAATHAAAIALLKASKSPRLSVIRTGAVPSKSKLSRETYTWVDPNSRNRTSVSGALPEKTAKEDFSPFGDCALKKVTFAVDDSGLGISIRGGSDQRLGIYVSGVNPSGCAAAAGLEAGDQIMEVNGEDFTKVTHSEAVEALSTAQMLMLTVKTGQSVPKHMYYYDEIDWEPVPDQEREAKPGASPVAAPSFQRRLHQAAVSSVEAGLLQQKMEQLLDQQERVELQALLGLYKDGGCSAAAFAGTLLQLLASEDKLELLTEVRRVVRGPDIETFDSLVSEAEFSALKSRTLRRKRGIDIAPRQARLAWDEGGGGGQSSTDAPLSLSGVTGEEVSTDPQPSLVLSGSPPVDMRSSSSDDLLARLATSPRTPGQRTRSPPSAQPSSPATPRSPLSAGAGTPPTPRQPSAAAPQTPDLHFLDDMVALAEFHGRASQQRNNSHLFHRRPPSAHGAPRSSLNRVSYIHSTDAVCLESPIGIKSATRSLPKRVSLHFDSTLLSGRKVHRLRIKKDDAPLGMTIDGGSDTENPAVGIRVLGLRKNGAADLDGRVEVGDEILQVNGISLQGCTHNEAVAALVSALQTEDPCMDVHIARG